MGTRRIESIDFGAAIYQVEYIERLIEGSEKLRGQIRHDRCVVELEESLDPQDQFVTIMHECFHYFLSQYGQGDAIAPNRAEGLINTMAAGMTLVLRKNPQLIRMIQEL